MNAEIFNIPTFEQAEIAINNGSLNPLDSFIYNHESANPKEAEVFRDQLVAVMNFARNIDGYINQSLKFVNPTSLEFAGPNED